jgi:hypothetical protein
MHPTKSVALIGPALREAATTSSAKNADEYLQIVKSLHGNLAARVSPIVYCTVFRAANGRLVLALKSCQLPAQRIVAVSSRAPTVIK